MIDAVHPSGPLSGARLRATRLAARLGRRLARAMLARATRRALTGLPDDLLGDIGLTRSDIPFVVNAIGSEDDDLVAMRSVRSMSR